jgi:multidrug efflux pump subunit AcrA (membrane-fusion protein)
MKRTIIITALIIVVAIAALFAMEAFTSAKKSEALFAVANKGDFEISITATGELVAEKSVDVSAPEIIQRGGNRGGGGDIRGSMMRITDIVPEGTAVKPGDYIAQLDRTEYNNTLKDDLERLASLKDELEMKILDSAVVLNSIRDDIKNQKYLIGEADLKLKNSKYESPDIIRQAEIQLDKAKRGLEQKERFYVLRKAQTLQEIKNTQFYVSRVQDRSDDLKELLSRFTVTAPAEGMVIYKKDMLGIKRKTGSTVTPFDRVVATIPDLSVMLSKTYVSEIEVTKLSKGMKVDITTDAFPDKPYKGVVTSIANIGEVLPNSDSKVFETFIRLEGTDPALRPAMTTTNNIEIAALKDVVSLPAECIMATSDSVTYVYTRNRSKQIVVTGEANDKNIIIEQGLKPGTEVYLSRPENAGKFRISGEELIPVIRERNRSKKGYQP